MKRLGQFQAIAIGHSKLMQRHTWGIVMTMEGVPWVIVDMLSVIDTAVFLRVPTAANVPL